MCLEWEAWPHGCMNTPWARNSKIDKGYGVETGSAFEVVGGLVSEQWHQWAVVSGGRRQEAGGWRLEAGGWRLEAGGC